MPGGGKWQVGEGTPTLPEYGRLGDALQLGQGPRRALAAAHVHVKARAAVVMAPELSGYVAESAHQGRLVCDLPQDWRAELNRGSNLKVRVVQTEEVGVLLLLLLLLLLLSLLLLLLPSLLLSLLLSVMVRLELIGLRLCFLDRHGILQAYSMVDAGSLWLAGQPAAGWWQWWWWWWWWWFWWWQWCWWWRWCRESRWS